MHDNISGVAHSKCPLTSSPFLMDIPDPSLAVGRWQQPQPWQHTAEEKMEFCEKSLLLTGAILLEPTTPTLCKASCPHHLGGLLMFCSQISQAARKVHYSWPGEDLWLQTHHPSEPGTGKPQARLFWGGGEGGQPPPGPPGDARRCSPGLPQPCGRGAGEGFIFSSIFRHSPQP